MHVLTNSNRRINFTKTVKWFQHQIIFLVWCDKLPKKTIARMIWYLDIAHQYCGISPYIMYSNTFNKNLRKHKVTFSKKYLDPTMENTVRLQFEIFSLNQKPEWINSWIQYLNLWDTTHLQVFSCIHQHVNDFKTF